MLPTLLNSSLGHFPKQEGKEKESGSPLWTGRVNFSLDFWNCVGTVQWKLCFLNINRSSTLTPFMPQSKAAPFPSTSAYKRHKFKLKLSGFLPFVPSRSQFSRGYNLGSFLSSPPNAPLGEVHLLARAEGCWSPRAENAFLLPEPCPCKWRCYFG